LRRRGTVYYFRKSWRPRKKSGGASREVSLGCGQKPALWMGISDPLSAPLTDNRVHRAITKLGVAAVRKHARAAIKISANRSRRDLVQLAPPVPGGDHRATRRLSCRRDLNGVMEPRPVDGILEREPHELIRRIP